MKKSQLLSKWLFKERHIVSKIYLLALLQGIMYLVITLGVQGIITYTMAGRFSASLFLICGVTIIATFFIGYFQLWQMRINETLHQKIFTDVTYTVNYYLEKATPSEEVLSLLNKFNEVVSLQKGASKILLDFSFSFISIVFGLILLPIYSYWFLFFTVFLGAVFYFIIYYYGKKGIETNIKSSDEKYHVLEWFQKNALLKQDVNITKGTEDSANQYIHNRTKHYHVLEKQYFGIIVFKVLFISILLLMGAYLVQIGELNIGQFVASEIIVFLVINSVEKLVISLNTFYDVITALYKIEKFVANDDVIEHLSDRSKNLSTASIIYTNPYSKKIKYALLLIGITTLVLLFMPWTQTVSSEGKVTALHPESKPQTITSRISGRIEKWYIQEGDFVNKNDTIAFISEIKDEYFDPQLINRSEKIIVSKETTIKSYEEKINSVDSQIDALNKSLSLKLEQARNKLKQTRLKITSDSIDAVSASNNYKVSEEQFKRYEELVVKGVISKTDLENRNVKLQEAMSKKTSAENKFISSKNDLLNAEIELNSIQQEYQDKLMKAESDKFSALSMLYEGEGSLTKLQNQLANYNMRKGYYYVLAPQSGYISKTNVQGIGEIVKEGSALCSVVPTQNEQAVELYIDPIDLPLIQTGQHVQLEFDGWPAFVFSGWPGVSFGTYKAEIVAFDKVISDNGKFRILAKTHTDKWPTAIQIGSGVKGFALLNNVPLIYELWRKINGFPPDFYVKTTASTTKKNEKK